MTVMTKGNMRRRNRRTKRKDAPRVETAKERAIREWDWLATNNGYGPNPADHVEPERVHVTINGRGSVSRLRGGKP